MESVIKFIKTRDVKSPNRANATDAGIDFYMPYCDDQFYADFMEKNKDRALATKRNLVDNILEVYIAPGQRVLIPSGIHTYFEPTASALIAANKSGVSTKKGLIFTSQVIDEPYTGELHIGLANISDEIVTVKSGEKLVQFVHTPVFYSPLIEIDKETFDKLHEGSTRGDGGFGSSDNK